MAAPNVVNVTTITGKSAFANVTTILGNVITNAASSGTVVKVNDVMLSNYTTSSVSGNVTIWRSGVSYYLVGTVSIPANSTLVVLGKDTPKYLEEGDVLQANVSANSSVHLSSSYEVIS